MSAFYSIIKSVITEGRYSLNSVSESIERRYLTGDLTANERQELDTMAQDNADPTVDVNTADALAQLAERVKALEDKVAAMQDSDTQTEPTYPEWQTGMVVYKGDRVTEGGHVYEYIKDMPGSWAPSKKPNFWQEVTDNV